MGSKLEESEEQQQQVDDECDDHVRAYVRVLHVGFDNGKYLTQEEIFCCFQRNKNGLFVMGLTPSLTLCLSNIRLDHCRRRSRQSRTGI